MRKTRTSEAYAKVAEWWKKNGYDLRRLKGKNEHEIWALYYKGEREGWPLKVKKKPMVGQIIMEEVLEICKR